MRRAFFGGLYIFIIFSAFQLLQKPAVASAESIWGSTFNISSNEVVLPSDRNTAECSYVDMRLRLYSAGNNFNELDTTFLSSKEVSTSPEDLCAVNSRQGAFSASQGYWAPTNNLDDVLKVEGATIIPVPDSNTVLFTNIFGSDPGGYRVSINYNLPAIGRLQTGFRGSGKNTTRYKKWLVTSSATQMQFANNSPMTFKSWAFSENGRYGIASLFSGMLVRVDLQTQEIQPISQLAANKSDWRLGISNDGKYALSYQSTSSALTFHDLTGCQTKYTKGMYPSTGAITAGCASTDLHSRIQALYPGITLPLMDNFRFGSNASSFSVDTFWRTTPSEITKRRIEFRAEGYTPSNRGYIAMGDSFSSGEGDLQGGTWYEPGTDEQGNKDTFEGRNLCHLSRRSYPYLIAKELGYLTGDASEPTTPQDSGLFHSVACSGAVIHNVVGTNEGPFLEKGNAKKFQDRDNQYSNSYLADLGRWQPGRIKQLDRLDPTVFGAYTKSELKPESITISISGNDAGFGDTIKACSLDFASTCKYAIAGSKAAGDIALRIMQQKQRLIDTYKAAKTASPESRIYVHGYPIFIQGYNGDCNLNVPLNSSETALVEEGVKYMNQVVKAAAQEAGVFYVEVEDILSGINLCSGTGDNTMAVNGVNAGNDIDFRLCIFRTGCLGSESFHPNPLAHRKYAERIVQATNNLSEPMPVAQKSAMPVPSEFFGDLARNQAMLLNNGGNYTTVIPTPSPFVSIDADGNLEVLQDGLIPGSKLRVELHSTPATLAEFTVPASGVVDQPVVLPADTESGTHELHIFGTDNFGVVFDYYEPILVAVSDVDFDGDEVLNDVDSCVTVPNSFVDADNDGVDDVCDDSTTVVLEPDPIPAPVEEVEVPAEEPAPEVPVDETPPETPQPPVEEVTPPPEVVEQPAPAPIPEKGQPNPETVAGDEEMAPPQVLGASTRGSVDTQQQVLGSVTSLVNTGKETLVNIVVGVIVILSVLALFKVRTRG